MQKSTNSDHVDQGAIAFMQPLNKLKNTVVCEDGAAYRVEIQGLTDAKIGKPVEIRYAIYKFVEKCNMDKEFHVS